MSFEWLWGDTKKFACIESASKTTDLSFTSCCETSAIKRHQILFLNRAFDWNDITSNGILQVSWNCPPNWYTEAFVLFSQNFSILLNGAFNLVTYKDSTDAMTNVLSCGEGVYKNLTLNLTIFIHYRIVL